MVLWCCGVVDDEVFAVGVSRYEDRTECGCISVRCGRGELKTAERIVGVCDSVYIVTKG